MLLSQRVVAEGGRAMIYYCAMLGDILQAENSSAEEKEEVDAIMSVLTPIAKAFLTETGYEAANLGLQVFGGHGYIAEWGMEQIVRDTRISTLYEGTTGIQALDLIGRKVLGDRGKLLRYWTRIIHRFCRDNENRKMQEFIKPLRRYYKEWGGFTNKIGLKAMKNADEVGAAAYDYLMYSGYVSMAYFWAAIADAAYRKLEEGTDDAEYFQGKIKTARFYFKKLLPRAKMHKEIMLTGGKTVFDLAEGEF
jgi:hypothetical protein